MLNQNIFIFSSKPLYDILIEVKNLFNFNILLIDKENFNPKDHTDYRNYIFLRKDINDFRNTIDINTSKNIVLEDLPITINKLIEKINILILKNSYQLQSKKIIKEYIINLNDRTISNNKKKIKLTEKELNLILFLELKKDPQNIQNLQNEIWGYKDELETHTVETHIYRLRKKIEKEFNDQKFIHTNKKGYFL